MSVTLTEGVTDYVHAVRAALADLPPVQRDELLDDLSQHLEEVAAESDAPLSVRLGPPSAYAEELRASIGLSGEQPPAVGRLQRLAGRLTEARDAAGAHPTTGAVLAFLPELRPGWWVLRGYLFVAVPSLLFDYTGPGSFPLPTVSGSRLLGLLATLAAVVGSVVLGRRTVRASSWRRLVVVGNTLLVLAALVAVGSGRAVPSGSSSGYGVPAWSGHLMQPDGSPITNIYPYGADGRLLTGVRLYDQRGRAIDNLGATDSGGAYVEPTAQPDVNGNPVTNAYPLEQFATDPGTGLPVAPPRPALSVPPLSSRAPVPSSPPAGAPPSPSAFPSQPAVSTPPSPSPGPPTP